MDWLSASILKVFRVGGVLARCCPLLESVITGEVIVTDLLVGLSTATSREIVTPYQFVLEIRGLRTRTTEFSLICFALSIRLTQSNAPPAAVKRKILFIALSSFDPGSDLG